MFPPPELFSKPRLVAVAHMNANELCETTGVSNVALILILY